MTYAWIDVGDGRRVFRPIETHEVKRSSLPCPHVITDVMAPVQSMLDGKLYDSKSALRKTYRDAGMIEVGNDPARLRPKKKAAPDRKAIRQSIEKAEARYARGERVNLA